MPTWRWLPRIRGRVLDAWWPQRKALLDLRARWGRPGDKDGWLASDYFDLTRTASPRAFVDDATWRDLELPQVFADMDSTLTPLGSQVLYRRLHEYTADANVLAGRYATYTALQADAVLRGRLQQALLSLRLPYHARVAHFIFGKLPPTLRHARLLRWWLPALLCVLAATVVWSSLIWLWLALLAVNVGVRVRLGLRGRTRDDAQTLQACLRLVQVADDLGGIEDDRVPQLAQLRVEHPQRMQVSRAAGWLLSWSSWAGMFPLSALVTLLNVAFLLDLALHVRGMAKFARERQRLAASFRLVGEIDAAIAVASWWAAHPVHCLPRLLDSPLLDIEEGCHPLLAAGVGNSIRLDARSALITGSNMAGKTTFIKMLGVNVLLAQTLGFCLAARAVVPRARVLASIQTPHSVASGKSHYFSAVERIRGFLSTHEPGVCTLFAIDELFSGTNTVERVAIARAVLEALGRDALVLATTHDVELQTVLGDHYDLYHFQEDPNVDGFFDYRLRAGSATARNAIRLLGEVGFPDAVVSAALTYAGLRPERPAQRHAATSASAPRPWRR